jgi:hypothetical protein
LTESDDHRQAAIARFAQDISNSTLWHQGVATSRPQPQTHLEARAHPQGADTSRTSGRRRLDVAARWALLAYPGPVGELISREISVHLSFGFRFDSASLIERLADQVLATRPPATENSAPQCGPAEAAGALVTPTGRSPF